MWLSVAVGRSSRRKRPARLGPNPLRCRVSPGTPREHEDEDRSRAPRQARSAIRAVCVREPHVRARGRSRLARRGPHRGPEVVESRGRRRRRRERIAHPPVRGDRIGRDRTGRPRQRSSTSSRTTTWWKGPSPRRSRSSSRMARPSARIAPGSMQRPTSPCSDWVATTLPAARLGDSDATPGRDLGTRPRQPVRPDPFGQPRDHQRPRAAHG